MPAPKNIVDYERWVENIRNSKKDHIPWNKGLKGSQVAWNKGKKLSNIHKENLKLSHLGYVMPNEQREKIGLGNKFKIRSEKTKKKMSESKKGNKSYCWEGGKTVLHSVLKNSFEYKNWRKFIFERDNYICQECFGRGGGLEAHHIKPFNIILREFLQQYSQFSPIEDKETLARLATTYESFWDVDNGQTLCKECHKVKPKIRKEILKNG